MAEQEKIYAGDLIGDEKIIKKGFTYETEDGKLIYWFTTDKGVIQKLEKMCE